MPFVTDPYYAVATVTDVRVDTAHVIELAGKTAKGVLIQRNNEPLAVLVTNERYLEMCSREHELLGMIVAKHDLDKKEPTP